METTNKTESTANIRNKRVFSKLCAFKFDFKNTEYNVPSAQRILSKAPILRALRIANKLLGDDVALLEIYR